MAFTLSERTRRKNHQPRLAVHKPLTPNQTPRDRRSSPVLRPGWPLTGLLIGFPLWWLLGVSQILVLVSGALMAAELLHTRRLHVRRSFGCWILFLTWVAVGVLLLQVNAPGAIPGHSFGRYFTFTYRFGLYLCATIALIYVYNTRQRVSTRRIVRAFACMFITVVGGGLLGTLAPHLDFPSLLELILPRGVTRVRFVHDLIHPVVAQRNSTNGVINPRASAPFPYTNDWALAYATLLPFFLVSWLSRDSGWRRRYAPIILIISVVPIVASQNRGLWLALAVSGALICVRAIAFGRIRFAMGALAAAVVVIGVIVATPLGSSITARLESPGSEAGRSSLGSQTVSSVTARSPIVGLGTTRQVQGSFYSIAGGDNPSCSGCTPPPLGTQGHFWLVIYSTGWGGLLLYLGFVLFQFFRHLRLRSPVATLGLVVLAVHFSTMLVYDTIGMGLVSIFVAIGLLWREAAAATDGSRGESEADPTIGGYVELVRRNRAMFAVFLVCGLAGGLLFQQARGTTYDASTTIEVPEQQLPIGPPDRSQTLDTIAQLVNAPAVLRSVREVVGPQFDPSSPHLRVTAKANTRLLEIHFTGHNAMVARKAAQAAASAMLRARHVLLESRVDETIRSLTHQRDLLLSAATTIDVGQQDGLLRPERNQLLAQARTTAGKSRQVLATSTNAGNVVANEGPSPDRDAWLLCACGGFMLGLLAATGIALLRHSRGTEVRSYRDQPIDGLPVLAVIPQVSMYLGPAARAERASAITHASTVLKAWGRPAVLAVEPLSIVCEIADALSTVDGNVEPRAVPSDDAVLVVRSRTRTPALHLQRSNLERCGAHVSGVVLIAQNETISARSKTRHLSLHSKSSTQERSR